MRKVWLLETILPNGCPVYLTEMLGTENAALVLDPYLALQFMECEYAVHHMKKCQQAAPPEVRDLVLSLKPKEFELQI